MARRRVALARRVVRRPRPGGKKKGAGGPNDETTERVGVWVRVSSSWIKGLRFVPTGRGTKGRLIGFVDMWVYYEGRKYRYGGGNPIYLLQFKDWRTAASKGKFWWYRWTRNYSPAERL